MKKYISLVILCIFLLAMVGCGKKSGKEADSNQKEAVRTEVVSKPDISQIRSICELSTLECYYHNVAKITKEKGTGLLHIGEKQKTFWIEYTGVAKIGIDMSEVKMTIEDNNVNIVIPGAKLISYKVEKISEENYISSADSFNKNPITADEQTKAVDEAQEKMKSSVESNTALLVRAQERAKTLIENYIMRLGEASGIEYIINWEYL